MNSGQLVSVAKTKNHITQAGASEASAVKLTIGSRKYQLISKITIQRGKYNLLTTSVDSSSSISSSNFLVNRYKLAINDSIIQ